MNDRRLKILAAIAAYQAGQGRAQGRDKTRHKPKTKKPPIGFEGQRGG